MTGAGSALGLVSLTGRVPVVKSKPQFSQNRASATFAVAQFGQLSVSDGSGSATSVVTGSPPIGRPQTSQKSAWLLGCPAGQVAISAP